MTLPALLPWQTDSLQLALKQIHGNAVLVHGAHGAGQLSLAIALARAWLCETSASQGTATLTPACGTCVGCHLFKQGHHPDLKIIVPEELQASLGSENLQDAAVEDSSSSKKKNLSREIKVQAIRHAIEFCQRTSSRGLAKVVLIHPAQSMNTVASNTLLKTLEEPPSQVRFILTCDNLDDLIPTVRSRCQTWHLPLATKDELTAWLQTQVMQSADQLSPQDILVLLDAAGGSPLVALDLIEMGWSRQVWEQAPADLSKGYLGDWAKWPLAEVLKMQQKLCHDLLCLHVGAQPRFFQQKVLVKFLPKSSSRLVAWNLQLQAAQRTIQHAWNAGLKLQAMVIEAQQALN